VYVCNEESEHAYWFKTDNLIEYQIKFAPSSYRLYQDERLNENTYWISIYVKSVGIDQTGNYDSNRIPFDSKVSATICQVIERWFATHRSALLTFTYYNGDGAAAARKWKFTRLWERFGFEQFDLINAEFQSELCGVLLLRNLWKRETLHQALLTDLASDVAKD
jgi:hypothetical protein